MVQNLLRCSTGESGMLGKEGEEDGHRNPGEQDRSSITVGLGPWTSSSSLTLLVRDPGGQHLFSPDPFDRDFTQCSLTYQKQLLKFTVCTLDLLQGQEVA